MAYRLPVSLDLTQYTLLKLPSPSLYNTSYSSSTSVVRVYTDSSQLNKDNSSLLSSPSWNSDLDSLFPLVRVESSLERLHPFRSLPFGLGSLNCSPFTSKFSAWFSFWAPLSFLKGSLGRSGVLGAV